MANWDGIPPAERNQLSVLRDEFDRLTGYAYYISDDILESFARQSLANPAYGFAMDSLAGFSRLVWQEPVLPQDLRDNQPWLQYGMDLDSYTSLGTTFSTEYKKLTGQDISAEALHQAFASGQKGAGGLLTGGEYAQQLMSDTTLQQTYGWLKYGMDYQQFKQQKLQMRQSFGRDLTDEEATSQLQYLHTASGSNATVHAQQQPQKGAQQQLGGSVVR